MAESSPSARDFFTDHYWTFLAVRQAYAAAPQPVVSFWKDPDRLSGYEQVIFDSIAECRVVLDVGAGDLRHRDKMIAAGFSGSYLTVDPSHEYGYDFNSLEDVPPASVDAILCLEVIEHIRLEEFFRFSATLIEKLTPHGRLIFSTPNSDAIWSLWSSDFTHVHSYRSVDLAAYFHVLGFQSEMYRVAWRSPSDPLKERLRFQLARVITRGVLQVDYAKGIIVVASRVPEPRLPAPARP